MPKLDTSLECLIGTEELAIEIKERMAKPYLIPDDLLQFPRRVVVYLPSRIAA